MKVVVATFNQEKALVGAFSVIVQPVVEPMDRFTALTRTRTVRPWTTWWWRRLVLVRGMKRMQVLSW